MKATLTFAVIQPSAFVLLLSTLYRPRATPRRVNSITRPLLLLAAALAFQLVTIPTAQADSWTATGSMQTGRALHTATLLPDGEVLVAGGFGTNDNDYLASAELYHPATGTWTLDRLA